ncbi:MAG: cytochrome P450 [Haliangiales bacterium]
MATNPTPAANSAPILDLLHPDYIANPWPMVDRMMSEQPIAFDPRLGGWLIGRQRDMDTLRRDPRLSSRRIDYLTAMMPAELHAMSQPLLDWYGQWIVMLDMPEHMRIRKLATKAFQPHSLANIAERIRAVVDELIDKVIDSGRMEFMRDFALPLPRTIICDMVGIPAADRERFGRWTERLGALLAADLHTRADVESTLEAYHEITRFFTELIERRRRQPVEGELLSQLVLASDTDDSLTAQEVLDLVAFIMVGGYETTTHLLANGILLLLQNPTELARLRQDPGLIPSAVEEMLRCEPPLTLNTRLIAESFEYEGHRFEAGQLLYFITLAINRDPDRFPDPHRFDVGRDNGAHASFGFGTHFCLGAALARLEGKIAFERLLERLPSLSLPDQALTRRPNIVLRALEALELRW